MTRRAGLSSALLLLLILGLLPPAAIAAPAAPAASPGVSVNPVIELLAGVQTQTDWMAEHGPVGAGSAYHQALAAFFATWRNHKAVRLCSELLADGFGGSMAVWFVCHLGPLSDLEPKYEYADDVIKSAGGLERLEEFRVALRDLAAESDFQAFLGEWEPKYEEWSAAVGTGFDSGAVTNWLTAFYGEAGEFHAYIAPAMYPAGGYAAFMRAPDGAKVSFQIIRAHSESGAEPAFYQRGTQLTDLSLHEWGHSYVNPAVDSVSERLVRLEPFRRPVASQMRAQGYGLSIKAYVSEQILRAAVVLAMAERSDLGITVVAAAEEAKGFKMTQELADLMRREYVAKRSQYPTFTAFMPTLMDWWEDQAVPDGGMAGVVAGWVIGVALTLTVVGVPVTHLIRRRRNRPAAGAVPPDRTQAD